MIVEHFFPKLECFDPNVKTQPLAVLFGEKLLFLHVILLLQGFTSISMVEFSPFAWILLIPITYFFASFGIHTSKLCFRIPFLNSWLGGLALEQVRDTKNSEKTTPFYVV